MNEKVTPISRDGIRIRARGLGSTASGIESYIMSFGSAEWVRASSPSPGIARVEVWSSSSGLDFEKLLRLVNQVAVVGAEYSVVPPTRLKRVQLFTTFAIGKFLAQLRGWLFEKLGGTCIWG